MEVTATPRRLMFQLKHQHFIVKLPPFINFPKKGDSDLTLQKRSVGKLGGKGVLKKGVLLIFILIDPFQ